MQRLILCVLAVLAMNQGFSQYKTQATYRATETKVIDLIHSEIHLSFNWAKEEVMGELSLSCSPHYKTVKEIVLDAKYMEVKEVRMANQELPFTQDSLYLTITLDKVYPKEDTLFLDIKYSAFPNRVKSQGSAAITEAKGIYFINPSKNEGGRMPQLWTQGETEANSVWFPTIDSPNQKHTQELFIEVEKGYKVLSNGKLLDVVKNENTWEYHWKQDLKHAPYLTMMAIGKFVEIKDSVQLQSGRILPMSYYVEPYWENEAKDLFGNTGKMIKHFSALLGVEFPWDKYSQVVTRNYVSGAMENTSAVVFGDFVYATESELMDKNYDDIIAHELFHHWFGDLLTCESWSNLPLNESFANYSQYLWDEEQYGIEVAQFNALNETFGYLNSAQYGGHHNMIWFDYNEKEDMFDGHSYNKGGRILHMLRNYLGDELFFDAIKHYLTQNSFRAVEIHDLRLAFEEISGEDLNWFFNQWFFEDHNPELFVTHSVNGQNLNVQIQQMQDFEKAPLYKLPINFTIFTSTGEYSYKVMLEDEMENLNFEFEGELQNFIVDGDRVLLAIITTDKPANYFVNQYRARDNFLDRYWVIQELNKNSTEELQDVLLEALEDPFWGVRFHALDKVNVLDGKKRKLAAKLLTKLVKEDVSSKVREKALHALYYMESKKALIGLSEYVLKNDESWLVKAEALNLLGQYNERKAFDYAKRFESEKANTALQAVARLYSEKGGKEQNEFFVETLKKNFLNDNTYGDIAIYYTQFLKKNELMLIAENWTLLNNLFENNMGNSKSYAPLILRTLIMITEQKSNQLQLEIDALRESNDTAVASKLNQDLQKILVEKKKMVEVIKKY